MLMKILLPNRADAPFDPGIDYNHFYSRGSHDVRFVGFDGETKGTSLNEVTTIRIPEI